MEGGATFHFVTDGIHAALERAREAAGERDVRLGGAWRPSGRSLAAPLVDELHLALRPILLGSGESLMTRLELRSLGYECERTVAGERTTHVFLTRRD